MSKISKVIIPFLQCNRLKLYWINPHGNSKTFQLHTNWMEKIIYSSPKLWRCSWRGKESLTTCWALDHSRVIQNSKIRTRTIPRFCHGHGIQCYPRLVALVCFCPRLKKFGRWWDRLNQRYMMLNKYLKSRPRFQPPNKVSDPCLNIPIFRRIGGKKWIIINAFIWCVARMQLCWRGLWKKRIFKFLASLNLEFD